MKLNFDGSNDGRLIEDGPKAHGSYYPQNLLFPFIDSFIKDLDPYACQYTTL